MGATQQGAGVDLSPAAGRRPGPTLTGCVASADGLSLPRVHLLVCDAEMTLEPPWGAEMHATRTTTYKARERCTPPKHQLQGGARCYSRRGEVPDRWRHRRLRVTPAGLAGVGATVRELAPGGEGQGAWATQQERRE